VRKILVTVLTSIALVGLAAAPGAAKPGGNGKPGGGNDTGGPKPPATREVSFAFVGGQPGLADCNGPLTTDVGNFQGTSLEAVPPTDSDLAATFVFDDPESRTIEYEPGTCDPGIIGEGYERFRLTFDKRGNLTDVWWIFGVEQPNGLTLQRSILATEKGSLSWTAANGRSVRLGDGEASGVVTGEFVLSRWERDVFSGESRPTPLTFELTVSG
jgi:hypothetical protein